MAKLYHPVGRIRRGGLCRRPVAACARGRGRGSTVSVALHTPEGTCDWRKTFLMWPKIFLGKQNRLVSFPVPPAHRVAHISAAFVTGTSWRHVTSPGRTVAPTVKVQPQNACPSDCSRCWSQWPSAEQTVDHAARELLGSPPPPPPFPNVQNTKICCGVSRNRLRSSGRRQYSGPLLWRPAVTSFEIVRSTPPAGRCEFSEFDQSTACLSRIFGESATKWAA